MPAQIQEFRFDHRLWRLDWLGRIALPAGFQSEPRIAVHFSELQPTHIKALSNKSLAVPQQENVAEVKIGQLPLLRIGSVWLNGIQQPPNKASDELEVWVKHDQLELIPFDGQIEFNGRCVPLLPDDGYRIGPAARRQVAKSWLAIVYAPTKNLEFVAIPSTVLFQRCMGTSPTAIRHLIYGRLDKIVDPRSTFCGENPRTFYLNLFKDFRDLEAPFLANLAADPIAQTEYQRLRASLAAAAANFDPARRELLSEPHIKMSLPFSNSARMRLRGKYLPIGRRWGFLATEIVEIDVRLAFDRLILDRKNDARQGENADDPDLLPAYRCAGGRTTAAAEPFQAITSNGEPARNQDTLMLEACGGISAIGLEVEKDPKIVQTHRSQWLRSERGSSDTGTTGEATGETSPFAEVDLDSSPMTTPVTLEQFLEALDLLAGHDFNFESIPVTPIHRRVGRHVVNYLPRSIRGVRSWHLVSEGKNAQPRGYVVAELYSRGVWHYLIELERKGKEARALAHIRHHNGYRIDRDSIQWFMVDVAKTNGWAASKDHRQWIFQAIQHKPSRGIADFVQAILSKL